MNALLDDDYLQWLEEEVGLQGHNPTKTHTKLLKQLHSKEFIWVVPNDDNRCLDGLELREEYKSASPGVEIPEEWMLLGCSVLEMLIGVARRLSFEADGEPHEWFWILLHNLDIDGYSDDVYDWRKERKIDEVLETLIWRQYEFDGRGGLFPLDNPHEDQRKQEIWYQLGAYVLELE